MTGDPALARSPLDAQKTGAFLGASRNRVQKYDMESQMVMPNSSIQPLGTILHHCHCPALPL